MEETHPKEMKPLKFKWFNVGQYTFEKDGRFTNHIGFDYIPEEEALTDDAQKIIDERIEEARQKVLTGKMSPVYYYMEKTWMDPITLSKFVGLSMFTVKRHFKPAKFAKLKPEIFQKYANAFEISVEELKNPK
ncbi:MAG: hypothetical protein NTX61_07855 [Bacteroidetes bacterium]|nr:hypothetical protein [Bacteroidota bacterium]